MKAVWVSLLVAAACARAPARPAGLVVLHSRPVAGGYDLWLEPAAGARINARLKPVLELPSGARLEFSAAGLTPDSAYFTESPRVRFESARASVTGTLRVGICPAGLNVCQAVTLRIDQPLAGS